MKQITWTFKKPKEEKPVEGQEVIFVLKNDTLLMGTFEKNWFYCDGYAKKYAQNQVFCWADLNEYFNQ